MKPNRAAFPASSLVLVEGATHEPVVLGDFVHLASGSPLGLVTDIVDDVADVLWLTDGQPRSKLPAVCLRPMAQV